MQYEKRRKAIVELEDNKISAAENCEECDVGRATIRFCCEHYKKLFK